MSGKFHHSSFGLVHAFGPFADKVEGFVKDFVDEQDPGPSPVDPNAKPTVPGTGTTSFTWAGKDYTTHVDVAYLTDGSLDSTGYKWIVFDAGGSTETHADTLYLAI